MFNLVQHLIRLLAAFLLAVPIGWDREQEEHGAGVRTFPLISVGSCGLVLVGLQVMGTGGEAHSHLLQGIITGIGFIGGGVIMRQGQSVHGTATAASIWNMCVIGAAVGYGFYDIAAILALINVIALRFLRPLKRVMDRPQ